MCPSLECHSTLFPILSPLGLLVCHWEHFFPHCFLYTSQVHRIGRCSYSFPLVLPFGCLLTHWTDNWRQCVSFIIFYRCFWIRWQWICPRCGILCPFAHPDYFFAIVISVDSLFFRVVPLESCCNLLLLSQKRSLAWPSPTIGSIETFSHEPITCVSYLIEKKTHDFFLEYSHCSNVIF